MADQRLRLRVAGFKSTIQRFKELGDIDKLGKLEEVAKKATDVFIAQAQADAPHGPTGNAAKSLHSEPSKHVHPRAFGAADIKIAPHIYLIEYGTSKMPPNPFMHQALAKTRTQMARIMREGAKDVIADRVRVVTQHGTMSED